ncbi:MAG: methylmalonyl-CoA mutase family protein [Saprospiraceae bacterium]
MDLTNNLFNEFPPVTKEEWLTKIKKDLKGKTVEELHWKLGEVSVDPFPHIDDIKGVEAKPLFDRIGWEIGEDIESHDILKANHQALHSLECGVESLRFVLDENLGDHRMESLLEGIDLALISTHFYEKNKNAQPKHNLEHFIHVAKKKGLDTRLLRGAVNWWNEDAVVLEDAFELVELAENKLPNFKVLPVNAHDYFDGADGIVQELANTIFKGEMWLSSLAEKNVHPAKSNRYLFFSLSVGVNYFVEIAKLRALRLLWANVMKAWKAEDWQMPMIDAHLAPADQTEDMHQNMIRATTQAMSAVIGGANRLTVLPSDDFEGENTNFSRRIARNVQHILKMESHLDWVADPVAGSYYVEDLTRKLAAAAWAAFQKI